MSIATVAFRDQHWLTAAVAFVYETIAVVGWRRTVGQALVRVRVAAVGGSERPTAAAAAIRAFVPVIGSVFVAIADPVGGLTLRLAGVFAAVWGLIVYLPVFGEERRGLHDRASGTVVLVDQPS